ncbi:MAG: FkbM family methyltransferase [bacterium]
MSKILRTIMASCLVLLTLVFILELSIKIYPPLFPLGLSLTEKNPLCSPSEALKGGQVHCSILDQASPETFGVKKGRVDGGLQYVETLAGNWWIPEGDEQFLPDLLSQQQNSIYGEDETAVQPGDVVLDCGAHIGLFTRKALDLGASVVVAIEISPPNIACLKRNFEKEIQSGRVIVYPKGVWHKDDLLTLYSSNRNSAGDSVVISEMRSAVETQVPLTTIDKIVEELELEQVDFVKMDIKGAAANALEGAQQTLSRYRPELVIATEEDSDHPDLIAKTVSGFQLGYSTHCGACTASPNELSWTDLIRGRNNYRVYPLVLFFFPSNDAKERSL